MRFTGPIPERRQTNGQTQEMIGVDRFPTRETSTRPVIRYNNRHRAVRPSRVRPHELESHRDRRRIPYCRRGIILVVCRHSALPGHCDTKRVCHETHPHRTLDRPWQSRKSGRHLWPGDAGISTLPICGMGQGQRILKSLASQHFGKKLSVPVEALIPTIISNMNPAYVLRQFVETVDLNSLFDKFPTGFVFYEYFRTCFIDRVFNELFTLLELDNQCIPGQIVVFPDWMVARQIDFPDDFNPRSCRKTKRPNLLFDETQQAMMFFWQWALTRLQNGNSVSGTTLNDGYSVDEATTIRVVPLSRTMPSLRSESVSFSSSASHDC